MCSSDLFWTNTPDILPAHLVEGGPPMFKIRAVLASLLSPSWGVYAGYELYERTPRPGSGEYANNEKYQLRPRDWEGAEAAGASLAPFLARLNAIRRAHPALHRLRNLRFHESDNDAILCWSKRDEDTGDVVLVACSFDPLHEQWANLIVDPTALGLGPDDRFAVTDQLSGETYHWGRHAVVRLDPRHPAHVLTVRPQA